MIGTFLALTFVCLVTSQGLASGEIDQFLKHGKHEKRTITGDRHLTVSEISLAGLTVTWIVLAATRPQLVTLKVDADGPSRGILKRHVPRSALAAINGGFFDLDSKGRHIGLGLLISEGKTLQPLHPRKFGGVLFQNEKRETSILPIETYRKGRPSIHTAIQSSPLVVEDGQVGIHSDRNDGKFNRSAVGILENGHIILAGAFHTSVKHLL